jgi:benzylsuccinate CoA-transferase BbsF subunit
VTYLEAALNGIDPQPKGNRDPLAAPHGCYRCAGDDRWCVISVRSEDEWANFCRIIGRQQLASDARFADLGARLKNFAELDALVQEWTGQRSAEDVMHTLQSAGIAAGVVQSGADLLKDVQLRHRNYFSPFEDSLIGPFEIPRSGFTFKGITEAPLRLPARLGADNEQILRDILGYDDATIEKWREEEVLA